MQIPPMSDFEIDSLEPVAVEVTLRLPSIRQEDVRAATLSFSSALARVGDCGAHREPQLFAELLTRCLFVVSHRLVEQPIQVLSLFSDGRFDPWRERRCEILVPSARGAAENQQTLVEFLSSWCSDAADREVLQTSAALIAIGSLSNSGRMPLHEAPEPSPIG